MTLDGRLRPARRHLDSAELAVSLIPRVENFAQLRYHWEALLDALEKCWSKLELAMSSSARTGSKDAERWIGDFRAFRHSDPLLSFLTHARNAENHGLFEQSLEFREGHIQVIVRPEDYPDGSPRMTIEPGDRGSLAIRVSGVKQRSVDSRPPTLSLVPVTDRGVTFPPPTAHCGLAHSPEIHATAGVGARFYRFAIATAQDVLSGQRWPARDA